MMNKRIISLLEKMNCYLDQYIEKQFGWDEEERRRRIGRKKAARSHDGIYRVKER
ncbi:MAG: hypothetical protein U9P07_12110 [Pseudomonadota bacterium]|nr:hypothetical protein [Pseudomonadota bacterium]